MKINIKSNKGMSLATIVISIILMIIILSSIILSVNKTSEAKEAMQLNSDIEELTRRVNLYYMQNGILPIDESEKVYTRKIEIHSDKSNTSNTSNTSDTSYIDADYYRLLVSTFDNLNLRNKEEIEIIKDAENEKEKLIKGYVINKETHLIYYGEIKENGLFVPVTYKYSEKYDDFYIKSRKEIKQVGVIPEKVESGEILKFDIIDVTKEDGTIVQEAVVTGLTEYGKSIDGLELVIPKYYKGKTVTTIGTSAFEDNENLKNIDLTYIKSIGSSAFKNCASLEKVTITSKTTNIEANAFRDCLNMKGEVDLSNVTKISEFAFYNCPSLEKVKITANTKEIEREAFSSCLNLEGEANLYGLTTINSRIFYNCKNLDIKADFSTITTATIADRAFAGCEKLDVAKDENDHIKLSNTITNIQVKAFYGSSISGILKSESITSIQDQAFYACSNIKGELDLPNLTTVPSGAFNYLGITSAKLPNVISIGVNGMRGCTSMTSIYMPNVQEIKYGAFAGCVYLQKVKIPVSCTKMEAYIFNIIPFNEIDPGDDGTADSQNPDIIIYCPDMTDTNNDNIPDGSEYQYSPKWASYWSNHESEKPLEDYNNFEEGILTIKWGEKMPTT